METYCPDCKKSTEVVFDHSAGDTVCYECGLVLEAHSIDETSEWRTFANESGDNDPVRVGGPSNPLLADGGLSTVISRPAGGGHSDILSSLGRWQNRGTGNDRNLLIAFKAIATMAERWKHDPDEELESDLDQLICSFFARIEEMSLRISWEAVW